MVQELRKGLIYKQSYSQFSVEIYRITVKLIDLQNTSLVQKFGTSLTFEQIYWKVCIFADFSNHGNSS